MVHIIFEDEEETGQTGKQNFKGLGKSDGQRRNKQPKNPSMPNKYSSGKYKETRKKNYKYQYSKKKKGPPIVGKRLFPYEENELMTRYDGFWVLKEGVEKLAQLKSTLEEGRLEDKEIKKKLLAAKRLAHSKLRRELMKREKQKRKLNLKEGKALKTPKEIQSPVLKKHKKSKKSSADSNVDIRLSKSETGSGKNKVKGKTEHSTMISDSSKEKDQQIIQNKKKKSKKNVQSANSQTISQEGVNIDLSPANKKNKVKQTTKGSKRKFLETDNCSVAQNHEIASQKKLRRKNIKTASEEKDTVICSAQNKNIVPLKLEENDLMTQFEGSWVKRTAVPELNHLREEHLKHIYSARENGNSDEELTKVEQQHYHRLMKKKIRIEYRKLRKELTIQGRKECKEMDENFKKETV